MTSVENGVATGLSQIAPVFSVVGVTAAEDTVVPSLRFHLRVVETSGFPILDKSAAETVRNVAPFPKPPVRAAS